MRTAREGFTLLELVVVMAIGTVLLALLLPAVTQVRETARKTQCTNNLRNLAVALTLFDEANRRLPPSGSFLHDENLYPQPYFNWAVSILPFVERSALYQQIDPARPLTDPANEFIRQAYVPVFVCPLDLSRSKDRRGDLSYAVNGGIGYTVHYRAAVRDCPVDSGVQPVDFNGDGFACSGERAADDLDRKLFKMMSLFFLETANTDVTKRHHMLADVVDGTSQTFLVTDNVRTGADPASIRGGLSDSDPRRLAFYIGSPCIHGFCSGSYVDYSRCNAGHSRINSGLWAEEGDSAVPNSFHSGGVNMAYADGHVAFLSESIDGVVYAALSSPQGRLLDDSPLQQTIVSGSDF